MLFALERDWKEGEASSNYPSNIITEDSMAFIYERLFLYQEESILSGREYHARRAFLNEAIITSLGAIHIGSSFSSAMD